MQKIFIKNNDYTQVESIVKSRISYDEKIIKSVRKIVADVKNKGDKAVLDYTNKFDKVKAMDKTNAIEHFKRDWGYIKNFILKFYTEI